MPAPNRHQNYNVYLPHVRDNKRKFGGGFDGLPSRSDSTPFPQYHVHTHGGVWRNANLTASSVEPSVAHTFYPPHSYWPLWTNSYHPLQAIISLDYTTSPDLDHRTGPSNTEKAGYGDSGCETGHPKQIRDTLTALDQLRTQGITDGSYVLTAHDYGACIAMQAVLREPAAWGINQISSPPRPIAVVGISGIYDLPRFLNDLDMSMDMSMTTIEAS